MIKKFVVILGLFMALTFISNITFDEKDLVEEDDKIEWNAYGVWEKA